MILWFPHYKNVGGAEDIFQTKKNKNKIKEVLPHTEHSEAVEIIAIESCVWEKLSGVQKDKLTREKNE